MTAMTSFTAGSSSPLRVTGTNGRFSFDVRTWFSASKVGIHTIRPHPPETAAMCSTAAALIPPTVRFSATPPNTSIPGHDLANQIGQAGRRIVVILQHDGALFPRMRELGHVNGVDRSRAVVGIAVHVDVDRSFEETGTIERPARSARWAPRREPQARTGRERDR